MPRNGDRQAGTNTDKGRTMTLQAGLKPLQRVEVAAVNLGNALEKFPNGDKITTALGAKKAASIGEDLEGALFELRRIGDDSTPTGFAPEVMLSDRSQQLVQTIKAQLETNLSAVDVIAPHADLKPAELKKMLTSAETSSSSEGSLGMLTGDQPVASVRDSVKMLKGMLDHVQVTQAQSVNQEARSTAAHRAAGHIPKGAIETPKMWVTPDPDAPKVVIGEGIDRARDASRRGSQTSTQAAPATTRAPKPEPDEVPIGGRSPVSILDGQA